MQIVDIVVIDDSEINLKLFQHYINQLEGAHQLVSFQEPFAGLQYCLEHEADLIILDYMMPGLDGLELMRRIRAVPARANVPIIMVTANDQAEIRYAALQLGANDFLSKPIDKTEFKARVQNLLALRDSQRKLEDKASWLADEVLKATEAIRSRELETIVRLSKAAEFRDPETGMHLQRMAHYSWLIAKHLGLPLDQQQLILQAAPMHDVGKVGIADHILLKPGRLEPAEFEIMKDHAKIGHQILDGSSSPSIKLAAIIALAHHEKFNGTGYPLGLDGEAIALEARIVAVADVFDALTSARPYKKAWPVQDAVGYLKENRGEHFDPQCVDIFLENFEEVLAIRARFQDTD
jgi:putative two-component system response regulator